MAGALVLIANPGSASRKYALFEGATLRGELHFEWVNDTIICTLHTKKVHDVVVHIRDLAHAAHLITDILHAHRVLQHHEQLAGIGLRIVAPGDYFLRDHKLTDDFLAHITEAKNTAPLHVTATLAEITALRDQFAGVPIFGVSDSAFHADKPAHAWHYGLSPEFAEAGIKRFGYHGISVASVLQQLQHVAPLPHRLVVCHLGSGASVTAVVNGHSVDTTMGYSPLEGLVMGTRSGSIDVAAALAVRQRNDFSDTQLDAFLNTKSGLLGLGGSADIRDLLAHEANGSKQAALALSVFVYSIQKAVGQMVAAAGGLDALVLTGTISERSAPIRERLLAGLECFGVHINAELNSTHATFDQPALLSRRISRPVCVVPTQEAAEIARRVTAMLR
ncbi:MAG TPA: hypothetical protein VLG40_03470 [Candidatus Saccharimonas sp.]|nr:hypothetical protein [Candidatus Saccharimonas sp.]